MRDSSLKEKILYNTKAVLFDMDGTLIDSLHVWADIDIEFLGRFGLAVPEDYEPALMGMSFRQVAEYTKDRFDLPMEIEEIMAEWNRMAEEKYANEVQIKPNAMNFIEELHGQGVRLAICTSNSRHLVERCLERIGIDRYMSVILTGDEITNGKPAPDIYLTAAERLGVDPENCIVFEDVPAGIEAGHNAGMRVCGVRDNATLYADEHKRNISDYYITDYSELQ